MLRPDGSNSTGLTLSPDCQVSKARFLYSNRRPNPNGYSGR
jgi:hypothetical protein